MRSIGSILIAVGAVLLVLVLLLSLGTDVVSFALDLVGVNDATPLSTTARIVIAGLAATAILLGIVVLRLPHKKTTAGRL